MFIKRFAEIECKEDYLNFLTDKQRSAWWSYDKLILGGTNMTFSASCGVCGAESDLRIDGESCESINWRETFVCRCGLNSRIRAVLHYLRSICDKPDELSIYITEQVTSAYKILSHTFPKLIGSEYLSDGTLSGQLNINGIRHEDLTNLSFASSIFDYVISLDVLEHVPHYKRALSEILRVLRQGGLFLMSVPFFLDRDFSIVRAKIESNGDVTHLLDPVYHGDPLNNSGVLCFHDFSWDLLDDIKTAGFRQAKIVIYHSYDFGYFGPSQYFIFGIK